MSRMLTALATLAAFLSVVHAQGACPDTSSCLGLAEGAACGYIGAQTTIVTCGTCVTTGKCVRACTPNSDQSTCSFQPTCTQVAAKGQTSAAACGTTRVINGDAFKEPTSYSSSNGALNLTITVKLMNWNATAFTMTSRVYCVGLAGSSTSTCSVPAAQIHVKPGDLLTVTLVNSLATDYTSSKPMNTLRTPNYVNMHTHGFHVDPAIDNVMIHIAPGSSYTYSYQIPLDHLPGNHWYHSHVHGASSFQVMGGMAGMLFVDPPTAWTPPSAAYAAMKSHAVQLSHVAMCSCNPTTAPFAYRTYSFLQVNAGDNLAPHQFVQQPGYSEVDIILVNGQYQPQLSLQPGEWRRLDIANAGGTLYQEIELRTAVTGGTAPCSMIMLAIDGIVLRASRTVTMAPIPPAGRISLAVMCPTAGTYYLSTNPQLRASDYEAQVIQNLITLNVAGTAMTMTSPLWTTSAVTYPYYLSDLTSVTATSTMQLGVDQTGVQAPAGNWLGVGSNCSNPLGAANTLDGNSYGSCAYQPFSSTGMYRFATPGCSVVDYIINGRGLTPHPVHMHVHVAQVLNSVDGQTGAQTAWTSTWGPYGEFRDTIPAIQGANTARFRAASFRGAIMIHCHFLFHEDMGMMDRWWTGDTTSSACIATSLANNCNSSVPSSAFLTTFSSLPLTCPGETPVPGVTSSPTTTTSSTVGSSRSAAPAISIQFITMAALTIAVVFVGTM